MRDILRFSKAIKTEGDTVLIGMANNSNSHVTELLIMHKDIYEIARDEINTFADDLMEIIVSKLSVKHGNMKVVRLNPSELN